MKNLIYDITKVQKEMYNNSEEKDPNKFSQCQDTGPNRSAWDLQHVRDKQECLKLLLKYQQRNVDASRGRGSEIDWWGVCLGGWLNSVSQSGERSSLHTHTPWSTKFSIQDVPVALHSGRWPWFRRAVFQILLTVFLVLLFNIKDILLI